MNKVLLAAICVTMFTACHNTKKINTPGTTTTETAAEASQKEVTTVTGKVDSIQNGKDGYTAKIVTAENVIYFATASISNSTDPKNYRRVAVGDMVTVKGELWLQGEEKHILVREFLK